MLETVTQGFQSATAGLRGVRALDEDNIAKALRDVRGSLLEADVDLQVVKDFLARVKDRALGEKVETRAKDAHGRSVKVTPGQHFVAICEQELTDLMGPVDVKLGRENGATSVMLIGLLFPPFGFLALFAVGAGAGALTQRLIKETGLDKEMLDEIKAALDKGTSALIMIGAEGDVDDMAHAFDEYGPTAAIRRPLSDETVDGLRRAMEQGGVDGTQEEHGSDAG